MDISLYNPISTLVTDFLSQKTCFELMRTSCRVIVLEDTVPFQFALFALIDNSIMYAPVWSSERKEMKCIIQLSDFLDCLRDLHDRRDNLESLINMPLKDIIDNDRYKCLCRLPFVHVDAADSLLNAVNLMNENSVDCFAITTKSSRTVLGLATYSDILSFVISELYSLLFQSLRDVAIQTAFNISPLVRRTRLDSNGSLDGKKRRHAVQDDERRTPSNGASPDKMNFDNDDDDDDVDVDEGRTAVVAHMTMSVASVLDRMDGYYSVEEDLQASPVLDSFGTDLNLQTTTSDYTMPFIKALRNQSDVMMSYSAASSPCLTTSSVDFNTAPSSAIAIVNETHTIIDIILRSDLALVETCKDVREVYQMLTEPISKLIANQRSAGIESALTMISGLESFSALIDLYGRTRFSSVLVVDDSHMLMDSLKSSSSSSSSSLAGGVNRAMDCSKALDYVFVKSILLALMSPQFARHQFSLSPLPSGNKPFNKNSHRRRSKRRLNE